LKHWLLSVGNTRGTIIWSRLQWVPSLFDEMNFKQGLWAYSSRSRKRRCILLLKLGKVCLGKRWCCSTSFLSVFPLRKQNFINDRFIPVGRNPCLVTHSSIKTVKTHAQLQLLNHWQLIWYIYLYYVALSLRRFFWH